MKGSKIFANRYTKLAHTFIMVLVYARSVFSSVQGSASYSMSGVIGVYLKVLITQTGDLHGRLETSLQLCIHHIAIVLLEDSIDVLHQYTFSLFQLSTFWNLLVHLIIDERHASVNKVTQVLQQLIVVLIRQISPQEGTITLFGTIG